MTIRSLLSLLHAIAARLQVYVNGGLVVLIDAETGEAIRTINVHRKNKVSSPCLSISPTRDQIAFIDGTLVVVQPLDSDQQSITTGRAGGMRKAPKRGHCW